MQGDPKGRITLRLPAGFKDGATLRLRGQGGHFEGGKPGDLYVQVALVDRALAALDDAPATKGPGVLLVAVIVVLAAVLLWAVYGR